ncbi:MFS transporter [Streptomyces sodiiphilus]|uniref:MFS transporter n=1 Tax=Streptomyces sodiiphilus TaxID=226217 RepID=A0ABP5AGZ4_9ACTN
MSLESAAPPVVSVAVPLRRNRNFQLLWVGSAAAFLGLFVAEITFPLLILALTGSPGLTSLFVVMQTATMVLVAVPAGRILDRRDRRRILIATECVRLATAATLVTAMLAGLLSLAHLLLAAVVFGSVQAFGTARMLLLRAAVPPEQLTAAVTAEEVRTNAAELGGPPLGGFLYGTAQVLPFLFAMVMFMVSAVMAFFVRVPAPERSCEDEQRNLFTGFSVVLREPTLRGVVLMLMLVNAVAWPVQLIAVVLLQSRETPPWQIGLALSGLALGALAGTAFVKFLHRVLRPGVLLMAVMLAEVPVLLVLAVPMGPLGVGLACFCFGAGVPQLRVLMDVLIVRQVPDEHRGRALTAVFTLCALSVPVTMGCVGLVMEFRSPAVALLILAGMLCAGGVWALTRRHLRRAEWPRELAT